MLVHNVTKGISEPSLMHPDDEKLSAIIQYLTESHLFSEGGYPYDHMEHEGNVYVAGLMACCETRISRYAVSRLLDWYDEAVAVWADEGGLDFQECLMECDPDLDDPDVD